MNVLVSRTDSRDQSLAAVMVEEECSQVAEDNSPWSRPYYLQNPAKGDRQTMLQEFKLR